MKNQLKKIKKKIWYAKKKKKRKKMKKKKKKKKNYEKNEIKKRKIVCFNAMVPALRGGCVNRERRAIDGA